MIKSEEKEDKKTILNDKDKAEKNGQQENIEEPVKEESLEEKLKNILQRNTVFRPLKKQVKLSKKTRLSRHHIFQKKQI